MAPRKRGNGFEVLRRGEGVTPRETVVTEILSLDVANRSPADIVREIFRLYARVERGWRVKRIEVTVAQTRHQMLVQ